MLRTRLMQAFMISAGAVLSFSFAAQADTIKLRYGHDQVATHYYQDTAIFFAKRVSELTNGSVEIRVFPNAVLGTEASMLADVIEGNIDFSTSTTANASSYVPAFGMFSVAYLFSGRDHFARVQTDDAFNAELDRFVTAKGAGLRRISTLTVGVRSLYNNVRPITKLEDVKDIKLRVMASPVEAKVWKALGALPMNVAFQEVYTALQTGMAQAAENTPSAYYLNKHHEVAPYFSLTAHQWSMGLIAVSNKTWGKLSPAQRDAIVQAGKETGPFNLKTAVAADDQMLKDMAEKSKVKVNTVDTSAFMKAVAPLQDEVAAELGAQAALARIRALQ